MSADARALRAIVLGVWACFFSGLWLTGSADHYLGPRTLWVVPFGACALALLTGIYAFSMTRSRNLHQPLELRETIGLLALLVPIALVLLMPDAQLGAFAASRKADGGYFRTLAPRPPSTQADISFLDIRMADGDRTFAQEAGIRDGVGVQLVGLNTGSTLGIGTFELARFYISCCVADAMAVGVPIQTTGAIGAALPKKDDWLDVIGRLRWRGGRWTVAAYRIKIVQPPANPYLSFVS